MNTPQIVLIEDEAFVLKVAKKILERGGYAVSAFETGERAIEFYREQWQHINLVMLDVVMPGMDGEAVFSALKEINPNIIAVISSGYSADDQAERILEKGAKGFIQKPYRKAALYQLISDVLQD